MNDRRKCAEVAASWWASFMKSEQQESNFDTDISGKIGDYCRDVGTMLAGDINGGLTSEQIEAFEKVLAIKIERQIMAFGYSETRVDYQPDELIVSAAEEIGIYELGLPWKSCVQISREGVVSAKCGYGADYVQIYPTA